jgi:hypothetical protein
MHAAHEIDGPTVAHAILTRASRSPPSRPADSTLLTMGSRDRDLAACKTSRNGQNAGSGGKDAARCGS